MVQLFSRLFICFFVAHGMCAAIPLSGALDQKTAPEPKGLININTASAKEWTTLPGIGPALAKRIIEKREQIGGFRRVEELLIVPGINEKKLNKIKDRLTVGIPGRKT